MLICSICNRFHNDDCDYTHCQCQASIDENCFPSNLEFTQDWTHPTIDNIKEMISTRVINPNEIHSYLEVGIFEARSACFMLREIICKNETSSYTGIDSWSRWKKKTCATIKDRATRNLEITKDSLNIKEHSVITILNGDSANNLSSMTIASKKYTIILVDGDHTLEGALIDMLLCWKLLRKDGIMILDDYVHSSMGGAYAVDEAFDLFSTVHVGKFKQIKIPSTSQMVIQKTTE